MIIQCDRLVIALLTMLILATGCETTPSPEVPAEAETPTSVPTVSPAKTATSTTALTPTAVSTATADVVSIEVQGQPGVYTFSVGIESPDLGCEQYVDWWEIVSDDGALIYRRILLHSHVDEQPFRRSGGPVDVAPGTTVWVRAHMNPGGYGGQAFRGSVEAGLAPAEMPVGFAADLAEQAPLPDGCAF